MRVRLANPNPNPNPNQDRLLVPIEVVDACRDGDLLGARALRTATLWRDLVRLRVRVRAGKQKVA